MPLKKAICEICEQEKILLKSGTCRSCNKKLDKLLDISSATIVFASIFLPFYIGIKAIQEYNNDIKKGQ